MIFIKDNPLNKKNFSTLWKRSLGRLSDYKGDVGSGTLSYVGMGTCVP